MEAARGARPVSRTIFIYALCEPGTRTVRYIGQTLDLARRFRYHLATSSKKKSHLGNWLSSVLSRGEQPTLLELSRTDESQWCTEERRYISAARAIGIQLVNSTDGGPGTLGLKFSEESKRKKSLRFSGAGNPMFGKPVPIETRERLRAASLAAYSDPEARAAAGRRAKGRKHTSESIEKMRKAALARPVFSEEHCAAISAGLKGRVFSPENTEKRKAGHALYRVLQHSKKFYAES